MYHVFLGAPTAKEVLQTADSSASWNWTTVSSGPIKPQSSSDFSYLLPPATLEAASRRISLIYRNIIFQDNDGNNDDEDPFDTTQESEGLPFFFVTPVAEQKSGSIITWDPTPSYVDHSRSIHKSKSFINASTSRFQTQTQLTQESQSYNYSDTSSIARFPQFHFSLHILTSLSSLSAQAQSGKKGSAKVNVLLAVLEVEGPDTIRTKKGPDAGKEISILKMILGDEDGNVCKLVAWREIAEAWGGTDKNSIGVKRGDIVLIQSESSFIMHVYRCPISCYLYDASRIWTRFFHDVAFLASCVWVRALTFSSTLTSLLFNQPQSTFFFSAEINVYSQTMF